MRKIRIAITAALTAGTVGTAYLVSGAFQKVASAETVEAQAVIFKTKSKGEMNTSCNYTELCTGKIVYTVEENAISFLSEEDKEILLQLAMAEAEGEGTRGKALVIAVVLNRVLGENFPDTVEEVVFQNKQFESASSGGRYYTVVPDQECYEALDLILDGWDDSNGALYFESCNGDSWQSRNLELLFTYGNHRFYK